MKNSFRIGWFLAIRMFLRGPKSLSLAPIIVICIVYVNLLFVPALIQGAVNQNQQKIITTLSGDYVVSPPVNENDLSEKYSLVEKIRKFDGVEAATAVYQVGNRIQKDNSGGYWTVLSIDPISYAQVFSNKIASGTLLEQKDNNVIILGSRIAGYDSDSSLSEIGIGSTLEVQLYNIGDFKFTTKGITDNKFYDADTRAYINSEFYEKINPSAKDKATAIYIKAPNVEQSTLEEQLAGVTKNARIQSSYQLGANFREQASTLRSINNIISMMAIGVAAITIFIVIYIDIIQRRRQIGTQRAIGVASQSIVYSYVIRACLYSCIGISAGGLIFGGLLVPYFERRPFMFITGEVSLAPTSELVILYAIVLVLSSIIASVVPAYKVTKSEIRVAMTE